MSDDLKTKAPARFVLLSLILLSMVMFAVLTRDYGKANSINYIIFVLSIILMSISIYSIKQTGLKSYNLFLMVFYTPLSINCLGLSDYQTQKELVDIYCFFVGPLAFAVFLYLGENIEVGNVLKIKMPLRIKVSTVASALLFLYVALFLYIYQKVGLKIFADSLLRYQDKSQYQIAGVSGLAGILLWTLIMLVPHVTFRLRVAVVSILILCSGILQFNRGNIMRILLFLFLMYAINQKHRLMWRKNVIKAFAFVFTLSVSFAILGEIRQFDPSNIFDIKQLLLSRVDSSVVNWMYAYSAINFDVLKLVASNDPFYFPYNILMPFINIFGDRTDVGNYYDTLANISFNGFNASTFLGDFIMDFGFAYLIEIILFGFLLSIFLAVIRKFKLTGVYCFVMLLLFMTFSGNYFNLSYYLYSIIFTSGLLLICSREKEGVSGGPNARC